MPDRHNNFGGEVLRRAAQRESAVLHLLGEPEIGDAQVTVSRNKQILRFDVSVRDFKGMQVLQSCYNLSNIEKSYVVREQILPSQKSENFTSLHILEGQVNMSLVFEGFMSNFNRVLELILGKLTD